MRRHVCLFLVLGAIHMAVPPVRSAQEEVYYARCNLKVLKGPIGAGDGSGRLGHGGK